MAKVHTEGDIVAVCQRLAELHGPERLTRSAVQSALRARAQERGLSPVGADNAMVGEVLARVRAEQRQARVTAAVALESAAETVLPTEVSATIARALREVEGACGRALAAIEQQGRSEADARIAAVDASHRAEVAVLRAEADVVQQEAQELACRLDEVMEELEAQRRDASDLTGRLGAQVTATEAAEEDARQRIDALMARLDAAHDERTAAQAASRSAELLAAEARTAAAAMERDLAVALVERDVARGRVKELEKELAALDQRLSGLLERAAAAGAAETSNKEPTARTRASRRPHSADGTREVTPA